jgi:hypothetical protein
LNTETIATTKSIPIGIYDGDKDEVALALNGKTIFQNILLDSTKQSYTIELAPEVNTTTLTVVRANLIPLVVPFATTDKSLIYKGESGHQFGFSRSVLSVSLTMSYCQTTKLTNKSTFSFKR